MSYAVGCVPYLNAKPLVWPLRQPGSPVDVQFAVPSQLPPLLDAGEVQAILVSSIESLRRPNVAGGVSISSFGEVMSVRLFSKVPYDQIQRLALDQSSMTSNALVQILLAEIYSCRPDARPLPPDLSAMLDEADAGLLIGDAGMRTEGDGLHIMDLGQAWTELTGLPFVWALWVGEAGLTPELAGHLASAAPTTLEILDEVLPLFADETGFTESLARLYLTEIMDYGFGEAHQAGLAAYAEKAAALGLIEAPKLPEIVSPLAAPRT